MSQLIKHPPQNDFPKDYYKGHFGVIGGTGSGKTYYTKYIIKEMVRRFKEKNILCEGKPAVFVLVSEISSSDWLNPEKNGKRLIPEGHVFTEWTQEIRDEIQEKCVKAGRGFIVFDDFKSKIDFHHDKSFNEMFRTFRHIRVQLLAIGHKPTDLPPLCTQNINHLLLFSTSDVQSIKKLADMYLGGNKQKLIKGLRNIEENGVVKINIKKGDLAIHKAPPPNVSGFSTTNDDDDDQNDDDQDHDTPQNQEINGAKNIHSGNSNRAGRDYQDNSTNYNQNIVNLDQDVINNTFNEYRLRRERMKQEHQLDLDRIHYDQKISYEKSKEDVKNMLQDPLLSGKELYECCNKMNMILGRTDINSSNVFSGPDKEFMDIYYPHCGYTGKKYSVVNQVGGGVLSLLTGDVSGMIKQGAGFMSNSKGNVDNTERLKKILINRRDDSLEELASDELIYTILCRIFGNVVYKHNTAKYLINFIVKNKGLKLLNNLLGKGCAKNCNLLGKGCAKNRLSAADPHNHNTNNSLQYQISAEDIYRIHMGILFLNKDPQFKYFYEHKKPINELFPEITKATAQYISQTT
jgi:hypothetical protein